MRLLVVGLGSIGRRHLDCLRAMRPSADITVWRQHTPVDGATIPEGADRLVGSLDQALATKPHAAVICGPAPTHVPVAQALAAEGIHLLVEKPLSDTAVGVAALIDACRRHGVVLMVGYVLRFHPVYDALARLVHQGGIGRVISVRAEVGQYLPDWRPGTDYRESVSARTELGGGALLELSHEVDYVLSLLGRPAGVTAALRRLGDLDMPVEDTVELRLDYPSAVASIHLDMLRRAPQRVCSVVGTDGVIEADFIGRQVRIWRDGQWRDEAMVPDIGRNALYEAELRHFLDCVVSSAQPCVGGKEGAQVMDIIEAARLSAAQARTIMLDPAGTE